MRTEDRTIGEQIFEQYLVSQHLTDFEYEKEHQGKTKHPDYTLRFSNTEYIFDVKQFDPPDIVTGFRFYDPLPPIREKINQAAKQFKEFKGYPCCLVLYNSGNPYVHLEDPSDMLGAMYGDPGIGLEFDVQKGCADPDSARPIFGGRGKMIRPHWSKAQNTSISAIMSLRHVPVGVTRFRKHLRDLSKSQNLELADCLKRPVDFDKNETQLGIMVYENVFAALPFTGDLFCGPYDERYGAKGEDVIRVYAGEGVLAFEEMENDLR